MMLYVARCKRVGFTLIEIMIVIAVIAILAGIAIPNFVQARQEAKLQACKKNILTIANAIEMAAARSSYNEICKKVSALTGEGYTDWMIGGTTTVVCQWLEEEGFFSHMPVCPIDGAGYGTRLRGELCRDGFGFWIRCHTAPGGSRISTVHCVGNKRIRPQYCMNWDKISWCDYIYDL